MLENQLPTTGPVAPVSNHDSLNHSGPNQDRNRVSGKAASLLVGLAGLFMPGIAEAHDPQEPPARTSRAGELKDPAHRVANVSFGAIASPSLEQSKEHTLHWLKDRNVTPDMLSKVEAIWNPSLERTNLERVIATFRLVDPEASRLIAAVSDPSIPVGYGAPELLKDRKQSEFFRANLGLFVAKELGLRRAHDEVLEILNSFPPEHTVDPSMYYFYKACAEKSLLKKDEAAASIDRLLENVSDAPTRYANVARMMRYDLENWKEQDLGHVERLMDDVGRRLDLSRGGKKTQAEQKEIIDILDRMIKEKEDKQNQNAQNGNANSSGQKPGERTPSDESRIMGGAGAGKVDEKKLRQISEQWGTMPPAQRAKVVQEITRDLPPKYRVLIEEYFKALARTEGRPPR
jgi:hypothetical protein